MRWPLWSVAGAIILALAACGPQKPQEDDPFPESPPVTVTETPAGGTESPAASPAGSGSPAASPASPATSPAGSGSPAASPVAQPSPTRSVTLSFTIGPDGLKPQKMQAPFGAGHDLVVRNTTEKAATFRIEGMSHELKDIKPGGEGTLKLVLGPGSYTLRVPGLDEKAYTAQIVIAGPPPAPRAPASPSGR